MPDSSDRRPAHREPSGTRLTSAGPKVRVSAFIHLDGAVLLVRQTRRSRHFWLLPGGAVERGETMAGALEREVLEECGIQVRADPQPVAIIQAISPDGGATRHLIEVVFEAAPVGPPALIRDVHEFREEIDPAITAIRLLGPGELAQVEVHPPIADTLIDWLRRREADPTSPLPFFSSGPIWAEE